MSSSAASAAAVAGGLAALGWSGAQPVSMSIIGSTVGDRRPFKIVLLADENDALAETLGDLIDIAESVVAIASRRSSRSLLRGVDRGVSVVDADLPLSAQLQAADRALAHPADVVDAAASALVRSWVADAERIDSLTRRELEILDRIMCGHSVETVADQLVVAVTTVRTHVRSILSKLNVPSQISAAAVACRALCGPGVRRCRSHQF